MALLRRITRLTLNSAVSDAEYINKLTEWQQVEEAPPQMQEHLRLRSEEIGTDHKKVMQAIEGYLRTLALTTWTLTLSARAKVSPKERARAKAKERVTRARGSPKVKADTRARRKDKPVSERARRIRNPTASMLFAARLDMLPKIVITEFVQ